MDILYEVLVRKDIFLMWKKVSSSTSINIFGRIFISITTAEKTQNKKKKQKEEEKEGGKELFS